VDLGPGGAGHPAHHRVRLSRPSAWRLLTQRLGWSLQRPERQAKERDEEAIARWVAHEWPRIK
jgi:transposase